MGEADEVANLFNISELVTTEHQLIQIGEIFTDKSDACEIVIWQLHITNFIEGLLVAVQNSDKALIVDLLPDERDKFLLLLVCALNQLRQHKLILGFNFSNVYSVFDFAIVGQLEYDVLVFESFYLLLCSQLSYQVYRIFAPSAVEAKFALDI